MARPNDSDFQIPHPSDLDYEVKHDFEEVFNLELKCWCFGISKLEGKIRPQVIHRVIKEFSPVYHEALRNLYCFDLIKTAQTIADASDHLVGEKEIAFSILSHMPLPDSLKDDERNILARMVKQAEDAYGGAVDRFSRRWSGKHSLASATINTRTR